MSSKSKYILKVSLKRLAPIKFDQYVKSLMIPFTDFDESYKAYLKRFTSVTKFEIPVTLKEFKQFRDSSTTLESDMEIVIPIVKRYLQCSPVEERIIAFGGMEGKIRTLTPKYGKKKLIGYDGRLPKNSGNFYILSYNMLRKPNYEI